MTTVHFDLNDGLRFIADPRSDGVYFPLLDTVVLQESSPEISGHEFAHRYSATRTYLYPAFQVMTEVVACKHLLLEWLTGLLDEQGTRFGIYLYFQDGTLNFGNLENDAEITSDMRSVLSTYFNFVGQWERTFMPWLRLMAEFAAIDLGVSRDDHTRRDEYITGVIEQCRGSIDQDGDFDTNVYDAWRAWTSIDDVDYRRDLMRLAMSFPRIAASGEPSVVDPIHVLIRSARIYETNPLEASASIHAELQSASELLSESIKHIRAFIARRTWPDALKTKMYVSFVPTLRQLQAAERQSGKPVVRPMPKNFTPLFFNMPPAFSQSPINTPHEVSKNETTRHHEQRWRVSIKAQDDKAYEFSSEGLGAYWSSEDRPLMLISRTDSEQLEAVLNPYFIAGSVTYSAVGEQGASWWRRLLFLEALRRTVDTGYAMSCPLHSCKVSMPFASEVAEIMRRLDIPVPERYDVTCGSSCEIRRRLYLFKMHTNFVTTLPFCKSDNLSDSCKERVADIMSRPAKPRDASDTLKVDINRQ